MFNIKLATTSLVAARGRLIQSMPAGAMLAVPLSEEEIQPFLNQSLDLAAINVPSQSVVSGTFEAVEQLSNQLAQQDVECQRLHTSHAFHSEMMDPILPSFLEQVQKMTLQKPQMPFISNVTGTWIQENEATDPHYWVKHLRQTVRFAAGLEQILQEESATVLLEVGPGRTLSTFAKRHPDKTEQLVLTSLHHPKEEQSDNAFILNSLGQLWLVGVTVNWVGFYTTDEPHYRLPLPTYPFERQRYWVETATNQSQSQKTKEKNDFYINPLESSQHHTRSNLPNIYTAPRNSLENTLADIWQDFLGITQIGIDDDFFELGGDSLIAVQLVAKLRKTLSVELSSHSLLNTPTIATLAESIEKISHQKFIPASLPNSSLVEIQAGNPLKIPLFLVHPAGGHVYIYRDLARSLGPEQPVYGLHTALDNHAEPTTQIKDKAAYFIQTLRVHQPEGPYLLGGLSFGGIVAFEIAQQLHALGHKPQLLIMIDPPQPETPTYTIDDIDIMALLVGMDRKKLLLKKEHQQSFDEQLTDFWEYGKKTHKLFPDTTREQFYKLFQLFKNDIQAIWRYTPKIYQGKIIFFRAKERDEFINPPNPEHGWLNLANKGMEVHDIPGNHFTMNYSPNVEIMAELLTKYLSTEA